jgi:two-component system, NtrC family, response regulator AtoC
LELDLLPPVHLLMSTSVTQVAEFPASNGLVLGKSAAIRILNALVPEIARTDIPVLLMGESGTGKDVYGQWIHRLSNHSQTPMKKLSCRTMEAGELLAYIKNLQNGNASHAQDAVRTLFLDGIDEADLACQKILISLLPDGEPHEAGSKRLRVIASAVRNLEKESEEGRFRRELYFRISAVSVHLPPLRDRVEDTPGLLQHFLAKYAAELGRDVPTISDEDMEFLQGRDWPGNVRELENLARKMVVLGDSRKALDDLRGKPQREPVPAPRPTNLSLKVAARAASREAERELIAKALEHTHWNRKRAARDLQISYKSLLYKIKQIGLDRAQKETSVKEDQ